MFVVLVLTHLACVLLGVLAHDKLLKSEQTVVDKVETVKSAAESKVSAVEKAVK